MSARAVIDLSGAHGRAAAGNVLETNAEFIKDFAFAAQAHQFCLEAAPSAKPTLGL